MKKVLTVIIVTASMVLALCSCTAEQAAQTAIDTLNSVSTSDSPEVMSVKGGYLSGYSTEVTVGDALDGFLSTPMWQYFQAESGEKIELPEEEKKSIFKLVLHKTMDYIEENSNEKAITLFIKSVRGG